MDVVRPHHHLPGYLAVYGFGGDDASGDDDTAAKLPELVEGAELPKPAIEAEGPHDPAAGPLHRGHAGEGARGARHRPAVDLRVDHADDPGPRLRVEEGPGARPDLRRVRGGQPARASLRRPGRLRVHRPHGGRPRRDRRRHQQREPWLHKFWFGNGSPGLKDLREKALEEADPAEINAIPLGVDEHGEPIVLRNGKYGPYVKRGEDTASVPDGIPLDELTIDRPSSCSTRRRATTRSAPTRRAFRCSRRTGRFGPYVQLGDAETLPDGEKPKMASLFETMTLETITLDDALTPHAARGWSAPHPADGEGDHRPERPLRPVPHVGRREPQPRHRGAAVHRHARRGGSRSSPSRRPSVGGKARPSRRSRSWATTPCRASPSC